jgi:hypothetical protein
MNELFKMNDHGDIWQEPDLFDQPQGRTMRICDICNRGFSPDDPIRHKVICGHSPVERDDIASGEVWPEEES